MKRLWQIAILTFLLAGCWGNAALGGGQCNRGLCVKIEVIGPIRWGEPITVTISTTADRDIFDLGVSVFVYPYNSVIVEGPENWEKEAQGGAVFEGGAGWEVNIKANQSATFTRVLRLPFREGPFEIMGSATTKQGLRAVDSVRIYLTREGGEVYYANTPMPTRPLSGSGVLLGRVTTSEGTSCGAGPCLTIHVVEPVRWGETVRVILLVEGKRQGGRQGGDFLVEPTLVARYNRTDLPDLGLTFSSLDPSVQIQPEKGEFRDLMVWPAGNGVWWITDVWANSTQEYTFWVTFPSEEGIYPLRAEAFDLVLGEVSFDYVAVEVRREGGKVFAPSLGTPLPTTTPRPTPIPPPPTPTDPRSLTPTLVRPTQAVYPPISPLPTSAPAGYP